MQSKLRSFARDLLYGVVELAWPYTTIALGGEPFRVPLRWRNWFCEGYGQPTFDFIRAHCKPGATLIDIGAHFGIFTISALRKVGLSGKVISFEPCAATRSVLSRTLELNGFSDIPEIRDEAVSNVTGESTFFSSTIAGDAANSLIGAILSTQPSPGFELFAWTTFIFHGELTRSRSMPKEQNCRYWTALER